MVTSFKISVNSWSAWAPGIITLEEWRRWAESAAILAEGPGKPVVSFLPALLRRRCSRLTRASLATAWAALSPDLRTEVCSIFASRHGEAETTISLLRSLAEGQVLSPTDFGLSVHNTTSGLFSIAARNKQISTAIASADRLIESGLVEVFSLTNQAQNSRPSLLVIADEPLPQEFRSKGRNYPYVAVAMCCSRSNTEISQPSFDLEVCYSKQLEDAHVASIAGDDIAGFLRWLLSASSILRVNGSQSSVVLRKFGPLSSIFERFSPTDREGPLPVAVAS